MKRKVLLLICFVMLYGIGSMSAVNPEWSEKEIEGADTARSVDYMTDLEKDVILYINLARMYPAKFAQVELPGYYGPTKYGNYLKGSKYIDSLIVDLNSMTPVKSLLPDEEMAESAGCFAKELGESGRVGHDRMVCKKLNVAECCSFGMATARDIVLQLLIDHDVSSLGHRKICLDGSYHIAGAGFAPHKKWGECCVVDYTW